MAPPAAVRLRYEGAFPRKRNHLRLRLRLPTTANGLADQVTKDRTAIGSHGWAESQPQACFVTSRFLLIFFSPFSVSFRSSLSAEQKPFLGVF
ncbi:hypothetical protein GDO78_010199 [Eleutherodactylus coqui]|uniref:Uncharacterized protein n=1 Tax=Eleutherodactylus coqui TaxID=57060 RepID=A0A8J6F5F3_ELECQ|nr:hypothetical protein GDO78_010199 [Eleutherodactylus coqui]